MIRMTKTRMKKMMIKNLMMNKKSRPFGLLFIIVLILKF